LCDECDKLLHQGKKRSSHATVKLYAATKEETVADKKGLQDQQESELDNRDQKESELDKGETVLSSSFLLVNDKEEIMVCMYMLHIIYLLIY